MRIVERTNEPISDLLDFYKSLGYDGGIQEEDKTILAYLNNELVCVVRICLENEIPVLRGMYMRNDKRGFGLGKEVLIFLERILPNYGAPCFLCSKI